MSWITASYLPTPLEVVRRMLKIARVGQGDVVYDLGCGEGCILITAEKEFRAEGAMEFEILEDLCRVALAEVER